MDAAQRFLYAIEKALRLHDYRREDLAARVGVSRTSLYHWQAGKVGDIKGANLVKLAREARVNVTWLMEDRGQRDTDDDTVSEPAAPYVGAYEEKLLHAIRALTEYQRAQLLEKAEQTKRENLTIAKAVSDAGMLELPVGEVTAELISKAGDYVEEKRHKDRRHRDMPIAHKDRRKGSRRMQ